jgi:CheY-like chemotaxis protein
MIEDNSADVRLFKYALDQLGEPYELEVLTDGPAALRFIRQRAIVYDPCVIILDLHLPRYDGIAILSAIREMPALAHVHVVLLTTLAQPEEERAIRSLGVTLYREKPHDVDELRLLASEVMSLCRGEPIQTAA